MRKTTILWIAALAVLGASIAQAAPGDRLRARLAQRMGGQSDSNDAPQAPLPQTIAYGSDPLQQLDVWRAQGVAGRAPLVMYVHGGGWKRGNKDVAASRWAPTHFPAQGYVYASINYRLVPDHTVEDEASDVAHALKALLDRADELGIDRSRVVILGHSAGAHLVALVGTDERYLRAVGLSFANLTGVIPNDGAAYDVPAQMKQSGRLMMQTYTQAFGTDPERQRELSPTHHATAPNAPAFLLIHVQRQDGIAQAGDLEAALRRAKTRVARQSFPGDGLSGHAEINRRLGDPDYAATKVVDDWLGALFGQ